MQGHVVTDQRRIVENQHEHSRVMAALNDKVESVLERLDHIMEHHSNFDQFLETLAAVFDDSKGMAMHPVAGDINLLNPTIPMPLPIFIRA